MLLNEIRLHLSLDFKTLNIVYKNNSVNSIRTFYPYFKTRHLMSLKKKENLGIHFELINDITIA